MYIFKREKGEVGIGITLKKKSSDGYSSWAKEKDIKTVGKQLKEVYQEVLQK